MPTLFLSYRLMSPKRAQRVLELAARLRAKAFDVRIDQDINGTPMRGWINWMEAKLREADFVLLVCDRDYSQLAGKQN